MTEEQDAENFQNVAQIEDINTVEIGEISKSPAKVIPFCKVHQLEMKLMGQG